MAIPTGLSTRTTTEPTVKHLFSATIVSPADLVGLASDLPLLGKRHVRIYTGSLRNRLRYHCEIKLRCHKILSYKILRLNRRCICETGHLTLHRIKGLRQGRKRFLYENSRAVPPYPDKSASSRVYPSKYGLRSHDVPSHRTSSAFFLPEGVRNGVVRPCPDRACGHPRPALAYLPLLHDRTTLPLSPAFRPHGTLSFTHCQRHSVSLKNSIT